jgi:hypothetical protein
LALKAAKDFPALKVLPAARDARAAAVRAVANKNLLKKI